MISSLAAFEKFFLKNSAFGLHGRHLVEAFLFSWNEYFASLSTLHRDAHLRLPGKAKVFREQFLFQHMYFGARDRVW
jgi:hypothetical protein